MDFEKVIIERHATRKFSMDKVEDDLLEKILEAGRVAPTAKNIQPIKIYVLNSFESLEKLDKATPCRYGASTVLLVCGDLENAFHRGDYSTYEMDSVIVATHMMLEATNLGISNIWIEMFDEEVLREEFLIPENYKPICLIPLGYEDVKCPPSPNHLKRKSLDEIVEYL